MHRTHIITQLVLVRFNLLTKCVANCLCSRYRKLASLIIVLQSHRKWLFERASQKVNLAFS